MKRLLITSTPDIDGAYGGGITAYPVKADGSALSRESLNLNTSNTRLGAAVRRLLDEADVLETLPPAQ
jgi:hypothetical protein